MTADEGQERSEQGRGPRNRHRGLVLGLVMAALAPSVLAGQIAAGDSAWVAEDYHGARIAYERALMADSTAVRALYRLAILVSWDGQLDSSLALLSRARAIEPGDPDVRLHEATVLAWAGRYSQAIARYDSLIADHPELRSGELGRAQTLAWAGKLKEADRAYASMLQRDATDLDALAGRGQIALWQGDHPGAEQWYRAALAQEPTHFPSLLAMAQLRQYQSRPEEARAYVDQALTLSPRDAGALRTSEEIRALSRPRLEPSIGWSRDSDKNVLWWQTLTAVMVPYSGLRAFATVGVAEAKDQFEHGTRVSGEAGGTYYFGNANATAGLGVRSLSSDAGPDHVVPTWRVAGGYRLTPTAGVGLGYARYAFDETALLISKGITVDDISAEADVGLPYALSLGVGTGVAFLSDGNTRGSGIVSVTRNFGPHYATGLMGRLVGYTEKPGGYFAPDLFFVTEARGIYTRSLKQWDFRFSTGLGLQQVETTGSAQFEYHFEGRVARRWATINEVGLSAGLTNSAVSSTTGAFKYYTALLSARIGL